MINQKFKKESTNIILLCKLTMMLTLKILMIQPLRRTLTLSSTTRATYKTERRKLAPKESAMQIKEMSEKEALKVRSLPQDGTFSKTRVRKHQIIRICLRPKSFIISVRLWKNTLKKMIRTFGLEKTSKLLSTQTLIHPSIQILFKMPFSKTLFPKSIVQHLSPSPNVKTKTQEEKLQH